MTHEKIENAKCMNNLRVAFIQDYCRLEDIRSFVQSAVNQDSRIGLLFASKGPDCLVVVKPNWVQEAHENQPEIWEPVISNPVVVLAVVEAIAEAMGGQGTICLCDAPHTYADFESIVARGKLKSNYESLKERYPDLTFELVDLRREIWVRKEQVIVERRENNPDPRGYVQLDLGESSLFYRHSGEGRYYGADYDSGVVNKHHCGQIQEYLLAGTPMMCDLFVNIAKLKTHKKTGITCCLKNLVGINGDKNWLPHHIEGGPCTGGDEFAEEHFTHAVERRVKKFAQYIMTALPSFVGNWVYRKTRKVGQAMLGDSDSVIRNGNWQGNDTCWRMALDLNRALLYGNPDGSWREAGQSKHYLAFVDGIIGGEGNGPLCPDAVQSGILVAGANPACVDAVCARLMGFDPKDVPIVARAFAPHRWPIADTAMADLTVFDERCGSEVLLNDLKPCVPGGFRPHFGWLKLAQTNRTGSPKR